MTKEVLKDFMGARLVSNNMCSDDYTKIYPKSNENLVDIYLDLNFEGKDVLSVVSSSDQIYTPKLLGANTVDAFDSNLLTKYYYYMRKWAILCKNDIYPYGLIDGDLSYLGDILSTIKITSKEEKDAFDFWSLIYKNGLDVSKIFYDDDKVDTLFNDKIDYIKDISKEELNFIHIDFFDDVYLSKKYDYIIMSNIIEYCKRDKYKLEKVRDNLSGLLKRKGKVICSNLINSKVGIDELEKITFKESFKLKEYKTKEGYVYIKK